MMGYFVSALPHFLAYFAVAVGLAIAFLFIYSLCTPHREFALIREGNTAAASQLVGTFIGFAIPLAMVIGHSVSLIDMLLWGAVAGLVQLSIYVLISRFLFKSISQRITENCAASGQFVGGMAIGFGILQAACMIP